jgi:hypothetical protein
MAISLFQTSPVWRGLVFDTLAKKGRLPAVLEWVMDFISFIYEQVLRVRRGDCQLIAAIVLWSQAMTLYPPVVPFVHG